MGFMTSFRAKMSERYQRQQEQSGPRVWKYEEILRETQLLSTEIESVYVDKKNRKSPETRKRVESLEKRLFSLKNEVRRTRVDTHYRLGNEQADFDDIPQEIAESIEQAYNERFFEINELRKIIISDFKKIKEIKEDLEKTVSQGQPTGPQ